MDLDVITATVGKLNFDIWQFVLNFLTYINIRAWEGQKYNVLTVAQAQYPALVFSDLGAISANENSTNILT